MLKDIQVTLYDIFGYFLPGFVFLAGIAVLSWAIFMPSTPVSLPATALNNWVVIVIGAYIAGHLVQAIANLIAKSLPSPESLILEKGKPGSFPDEVIDLVESRVKQALGAKLKDMKPGFLYQVCDEAIAQFGVTSDRDIYIYREGFYRGSAVSFLTLFLSLMIRGWVPGASMNISGTAQPVSASVLLFLGIVSFLAACLNYQRYQRFGSYRVREAVLGFLLLEQKKNTAKTK